MTTRRLRRRTRRWSRCGVELRRTCGLLTIVPEEIRSYGVLKQGDGCGRGRPDNERDSKYERSVPAVTTKLRIRCRVGPTTGSRHASGERWSVRC